MGCNPTRDPNGNHSTILHTMESGSIIRPPPRTNHCRDLPEKHTTKQFCCSMFCETGTNDPLRFPCREPGCPYSSLVLSHELMPCLRKPHHHSGVFSSWTLSLYQSATARHVRRCAPSSFPSTNGLGVISTVALNMSFSRPCH